MQFSCWNDWKYVIRRLEGMNNDVVERARNCIEAIEAGAVDPTNGATHYLNEEVTRRIRGDGSLPSWVEAMEHTVKIGHHDFYKEIK